MVSGFNHLLLVLCFIESLNLDGMKLLFIEAVKLMQIRSLNVDWISILQLEP